MRGVENEVADWLSRNKLDQVLRVHPQMRQEPERVEEEVLQVVIRERQAGGNPDWSRLWQSSSRPDDGTVVQDREEEICEILREV